jgi:hypothetical protein
MVLLRELGLLALAMYRMDADAVAREVEEILKKVPGDVKKEVDGVLAELRDSARAGRWEDAWRSFELAVDALAKLDPVISAYVTEETREAYEKAARPEETVSYYARKVLEGERSPATPPDGVRAAHRAAEQVGVALKADWERELEEILKPVEVDWEKRLREYLSGSTSSSWGSSNPDELTEEQRRSVEMYKSWVKSCREVTEEFLDLRPGERIFEVEYLAGGKIPTKKYIRYVPEWGFSLDLLVRAMQEKCLEMLG